MDRNKPILKDIDTIIFDFDGTLFNGKSLSLPIYQECLEKLYKKFNLKTPYPSESKILEQFGKQTPDLYYSLLETTDENVINFLGNCVEEAEVTAFKSKKGSLYPNVYKTLVELKQRGYKLAICTNARSDYFEAAAERFDLKNYFDSMSAAGNYPGKDKSWMVKNIIKNLDSKKFAVVGDRKHDIEAAKLNGGISIGCTYGFGMEEVNNADIIINDFSELMQIFP